MRRLVFVAVCGIYKVFLDAAMSDPEWTKGTQVVGFIDDNPCLTGQTINGKPVLGSFRDIDAIKKQEAITDAVICIPEGYMHIRKRYFEHCRRIGLSMSGAVHKTSVISPSASLGEGVIALAGSVINPHACVGDGVLIWTQACVEHDNVIEDHVYLSPGVKLGGHVRVGEASLLGIGSTVMPGISIGKGSVIGAGALVTKDIPDGMVAYGVPARVVRPVSALAVEKE